MSYRWHLRMVMASRGMFATSELMPLLSARGVVLSREQVYRLVAKVPERLSLTTLVALCDILDCTPTDLIEPVRSTAKPAVGTTEVPEVAARQIRPRRARVDREADR
jgi:DNA-binding Xre family transcriptional regulator